MSYLIRTRGIIICNRQIERRLKSKIYFSFGKFYLSFCKTNFTFEKNYFMSPRLLLPHRYKLIGWIILVPAAIVGLTMLIFETDIFDLNANVFALINENLFKETDSFGIINTNIIPTLAGSLFIIGAMMVGFSKEKREDEFISNLRQSSLLWAVLVNYSLLLFCFLFIYGMSFINVMLYNMFTTLIIFIIRFNYILYRNYKAMPNEKYTQSAASH